MGKRWSHDSCPRVDYRTCRNGGYYTARARVGSTSHARSSPLSFCVDAGGMVVDSVLRELKQRLQQAGEWFRMNWDPRRRQIMFIGSEKVLALVEGMGYRAVIA